ncbi:hypothetical protein BpHYR1_047562 [Brachionus plicatilis]|uniref:Uncharacterized protein n=1 Tax=Brachionus plicatilis TaxID=10195 RepID=A0A3M7SRJ4_BRAPC|nr:hypothetical protein BpHYR1_047562 [Brachionus plicatilis]
MKHNEPEVDLNSAVVEHEVQTEELGVVGEPNNEDSEWADANDEANDERQCQFCSRLFKSKRVIWLVVLFWIISYVYLFCVYTLYL